MEDLGEWLTDCIFVYLGWVVLNIRDVGRRNETGSICRLLYIHLLSVIWVLIMQQEWDDVLSPLSFTAKNWHRRESRRGNYFLFWQSNFTGWCWVARAKRETDRRLTKDPATAWCVFTWFCVGVECLFLQRSLVLLRLDRLFSLHFLSL